MKIRLLERIADLFPYLVLSTYIAGCIFCLWIDRISYLINGSILAIPAIIGSFTFLFIKRGNFDLSEEVGEFSYNPLVSPMIFLLLYILSILVFLRTPVDSQWPLLLVLLQYGVIFVQIGSTRVRPTVVLLEVLLIFALTIFSKTLLPALYFGGTDIVPHNYMSTVTYLSGHVIPGELGTYIYFPLYHVFVALSAYVLGLDTQTSHFIITGLIFSSTVLFLYYLANSIFHNKQIALLAVLAYAMNADVVYYGTYMVTRTMAYVGFLILLYILHVIGDQKADVRQAVVRPTTWRTFAVVMVVFILLTHQVSTPMIIILLGLLFIIGLFIQERNRVDTVFLVVPISLLVSYWLFVAYPFIDALFPRAQALSQNIAFTEVASLGWSFLLNQIDSLLVIIFALTGSLYLIWKQQPKYSVVFGILGVMSIVLNVPGALNVIFQFVTVLCIDRFGLLLLPMLAIAMGVGIYILTRSLSTVQTSPGWIGKLAIIALVALYGIGSLGFIGDEPDYSRYHFNQNEVTGFNHVLESVPSGSDLHADYYTARFFTRKQIVRSEELKLPYYTNHLLGSGLKPTEGEGYIILTSDQFRHGGLLLGEPMAMEEREFDPEQVRQPYLPTEENIHNMTQRLSTEDKIYTNSGLDIYQFYAGTGGSSGN